MYWDSFETSCDSYVLSEDSFTVLRDSGGPLQDGLNFLPRRNKSLEFSFCGYQTPMTGNNPNL